MLRVSKDCVFPSSSVILPSIAGGLSWCELAVVMRARQAPCDSQLREIYAGARWGRQTAAAPARRPVPAAWQQHTREPLQMWIELQLPAGCPPCRLGKGGEAG